MLNWYLTKLEEIVTGGVTYSVHVQHCFDIQGGPKN